MRYEMWPDNRDSFALYGELFTRWQKDANGVNYAFDWPAVMAHLALTTPNKTERRERYDDIAVMERAAIPVHYDMANVAMEEAQRKAKQQQPNR